MDKQPKKPPVVSADHLLYLLEIYRGKFDERLRQGRYADEANLTTLISDMLALDLVRYGGTHYVSAKGCERILDFLADELRHD